VFVPERLFVREIQDAPATAIVTSRFSSVLKRTTAPLIELDWKRPLQARRRRRRDRLRALLMPTALDNGLRSPRKLLAAVVARLLGRESKKPNDS
jgi:hypothetical protein